MQTPPVPERELTDQEAASALTSAFEHLTDKPVLTLPAHVRGCITDVTCQPEGDAFVLVEMLVQDCRYARIRMRLNRRAATDLCLKLVRAVEQR